MPESGQPVPLDMGYTDKTWPSVERDHAATVSYMDLKIGQLMKQLQTLGIDEKTICSLVELGLMYKRKPHNLFIIFFGTNEKVFLEFGFFQFCSWRIILTHIYKQ